MYFLKLFSCTYLDNNGETSLCKLHCFSVRLLLHVQNELIMYPHSCESLYNKNCTATIVLCGLFLAFKIYFYFH